MAYQGIQSRHGKLERHLVNQFWEELVNSCETTSFCLCELS